MDNYLRIDNFLIFIASFGVSFLACYTIAKRKRK